MRNFCTLSDYNYLSKGLVLYESLLKNSSESFNLYYLCTDKEAYDKLIGLNLKNITPLFAQDLDGFIYKSVDLRSYFWSLASRLCFYLINHENVDDILYIDSDIVFYHDFEKIYNEIGDKSVGIIPHLHNKRGGRAGAYNVGIIYFRGDENGKACLGFWNDCVTNPNNPYKKEYGVCWDQKYLELFEIKFPNDLCIIQDTITQGAPWNFALFDYKDNMEVIFKPTNKNLPMVLVHFSRFILDFENETYEFDKRLKDGIYVPFYTPTSYEILEVKLLCDDYYALNKEVKDRYSL